MPNSPITGPCTDPHFADPGQTSPPTVGGVRRNASTAAECICPTAVCNRSIGREFWARPIGNIGRIREDSGQVGPYKCHERLKKAGHFGCFLSDFGRDLICVRHGKRSRFPNCTALNHAELPPPFLSRRGQFIELSVIAVTEGNDRCRRWPSPTAISHPHRARWSASGDGRNDRHARAVRRRRLQPLLEAHVVV